MQPADTVPLRGVAAKVILGGGGARRAHRGEPLAVANDDRIVGIEPPDHDAGQIGGSAALAETKEGPRALTETLDQAGLGKEPQMPRQPGLRLAQNLGEVGNRQFGLGKQRQNAQPRRFARRFQTAGEAGKTELLIDPSPALAAGTQLLT